MQNTLTRHTLIRMALGNVLTDTRNAKIGNLKVFMLARLIAEENWKRRRNDK